MYYREIHDDESTYRDELKRLTNMNDTAIFGKFEMPPLAIKPKIFVNRYFGPNSRLPMAQFHKGTTTLAFIYKPKTPEDKGGIIVAVDSRATGGQFIASKTIMKILPINEQMVATMAGGAADCQFWVRAVTQYCNLFELREGQPISVAAASKYFANVLYNYRNKGLSVGSMVAGIDKRGPSLYLVENSGMRLKLPAICSVGSGMMNALAILDTKHKDVMTDQEAIQLGREAIMHATYRDAGSGGRCNLCHITPGKTVFYPPMDVSEMYYEFAKKTGKDVIPQLEDDSALLGTGGSTQSFEELTMSG